MPSPLTNLRLLILHISHSQLWWALYVWQSKHLKWRLREWVGSNYKRQYEGRCKCDFGWTWGIDLPSSIPGKLLTSNYCTLVHFCSVFTMLLYTSLQVAEFGGILGLFVGFSFMALWDGLHYSYTALDAWKKSTLFCTKVCRSGTVSSTRT